MKLGDVAAFPVPSATRADGEILQYPEGGMTLRQYFAGLAMQGLLANPEHHNYYNRLEKEGTSKQKIAEWKSARAVLYADALIAELEKQP